jgi:hemerythrin-like domain-containing protein
MTINTSDTEWKVSAKFKPDKDDQWKHSPDKDGWVKAHNMIRDEVDSFIDALESISNKNSDSSTPSWAITSIKQFWSHHEHVVHTHHNNEDNIMNPFMKTRINLPDKLEADHNIIIERMTNVTNCVNALKEDSSLDQLSTAMSSYREYLFPHLIEEEEIALPLLRSFFTPKEVRAPLMKILKSSTKEESGSFIHSMGEDYFRSTFMKQEGIPFFVWHLKFKREHSFFLNKVRYHIDVLNEGQPIVITKATMLC